MNGQVGKVVVGINHGTAVIAQNAAISRICSGLKFAEGPAFLADEQALIFSDIPNNRILRWHEDTGLTTYRQPSNFANGNTVDMQGNLITCEHATRRIVRTTRMQDIEVIVDSYKGKRLNSPNDVVVKPQDGTIWFTDPPYGLADETLQEIATSNVYRFDPTTSELRAVIDDFDRPNGLAFSPDGTLLYVADSGAARGSKQSIPFIESRPRHVRVFAVSAEGHLSGGDVFVEIAAGIPDGIRVDSRGNLWTTAWDGVHCYTNAGIWAASIMLPEIATNLTFDGPAEERLFVTTEHSVFRVSLK